jgi:hypothetical protein
MHSHASSHALSVTSCAFVRDEDKIHDDAPQPSVTSNAFIRDKDEIHDDAPQPPPSPLLPSTIGKSAEEFANPLAHLQLYDNDNDDDVKEEEPHDSKPPVSNPKPFLGLMLYDNDDEEDEIVLSCLPQRCRPPLMAVTSSHCPASSPCPPITHSGTVASSWHADKVPQSLPVTAIVTTVENTALVNMHMMPIRSESNQMKHHKTKWSKCARVRSTLPKSGECMRSEDD